MISGRTTWSSGRRHLQANGIETGLVGRIGVATAGVVGSVGFLDLLEHDGVVLHLVGA
jgi:hypothetical protein